MFNVMFLYSLKITNHTAVCHWQVLTTLIPLLGVELLVSSAFTPPKEIVGSFNTTVSLLKEKYLNMYFTSWFLTSDLNCYLKHDNSNTLPLLSIFRDLKNFYGSHCIPDFIFVTKLKDAMLPTYF
jgi:hypothetical protein